MIPSGGGGAGEGEGKPSARRDRLLEIQNAQQRKWEEAKLFEAQPPAPGMEAPEGKFFGNFPYPYMNGLLHLGHAFSLSKLEFAAAYHRLCGKRVLFPQGFHCTGMPIKACADKLNREFANYGCPPKFPEEDEAMADVSTLDASDSVEQAKADPTKFSGKKSKAAAKKGPGATQWQILKQSGIPEGEIPDFRDSAHWLRYFPPLAERDMRAMGCGVDWRRAFITTDMNPYYDSFVRWQFWTLHKQGKITKDKRYAVFSPLDGQPCADHDRASGEGVGPQDYMLTKMRALELPGKLAALVGAGPVFLMAATLRPETMYGQTNCWALPEGKYGAFRGLDGEVYVMTARAALNLSYQERTPVRGDPECLLELTGQDLMGVPLSAPNSPFERIYVLPLLTIHTNKGTGIVTSVPSDSPDDYTALMDLKKKPKLREKYGILDDWVMPFEVIPIIDIPGYGDKSAEAVCAQLKVQSQNDTAKLAEAKQLVYLKGFTDGVMTVGPHTGKKVSEAKPIIRDEMLAAGQALPYSEPEKTVISRSGDECVVALTDQWYLAYGEDAWRDATLRALEGMETYSEECRHAFTHTLGWLQQWACSRSFGLGTRLPWDEQYLIESLSDSTIYMAYYTVAHYFQNGDMYGETRGAICPEHMTNEVWDYIFLRGPAPKECAISQATLDAMRAEFEFWYPFDLRVSGKDLIQNHLTFSLYNHVAIWGEDKTKLPAAFRCNGHLLLNSEKMSKSTGNFKTLSYAIAEYSADAMRWALADAGDALDDANFETTTANAAILRLTKELAWIEEVLAPGAGLRDGAADTVQDKVFANEIAIAVHRTKEAYDKLLFREALKAAAYDLGNARDVYRFSCGPEGMHRGLITRYIETSTLLLVPITPHTSDHVWTNLLKKQGSVLIAGWPQSEAPDFVLERAAQYIESTIVGWRKLIAKVEAPPKKKKKSDDPPPVKVTHGDVFVAERFGGWQEVALRALSRCFNDKNGGFSGDAFNVVNEELKAAATGGVDPALQGLNDKQLKALTMPFIKFKMDEAIKAGPQVLDVRLPFDERQLLRDNKPYLLRALGLSSLQVHSASDLAVAAAAHANVGDAYPAAPIVVFAAAPPQAAPVGESVLAAV